MIVRYVKVIFFCFNIKYSMVFIEYITMNQSLPHRTKHAFSDIIISQGSVATRLRCGGIVNHRCVANFLEIVTVKEFLKSANICH